MARHRRPRAAPKASPAREPTMLEPSATFRRPRAPVPSSEATRERLTELLALLDREGYRHPFLAAESRDGWARAVEELLERYRLAADPLDAARHLGAACRQDPRLFASPLVRDQLLVWRLEVAESVVRRDLPAVHLRGDAAAGDAEHARRKLADDARSALTEFGRALAEVPRKTYVAADVFERVYLDVEARVQQAIAEARFGRNALTATRSLRSAALKRAGLAASEPNVIALGAAQGRGLEIIEREVGSRLGLSRTKVRGRRAQLIPDAERSAASAFNEVMLRSRRA